MTIVGEAVARRGAMGVLLASALAQLACSAMLLGGGQAATRPAGSTLARSVSATIATDQSLREQSISVSSDGAGLVILRGRVASSEQKQRAETLARSVAGVTDVDNRLAVASGS